MMKSIGVYDKIYCFTEDVYWALEANGYFSRKDIDRDKFFFGMNGYVMYNLMTINSGDDVGVIVPAMHSSFDSDEGKIFSPSLQYAFLMAGFNYEDPRFQNCNFPSKVFALDKEGIALSYKEIRDIMQEWHLSYKSSLDDMSLDNFYYPVILMELACDRNNEIMKYGLIDNSVIENAFSTLVNYFCKEYYPHDTLSRELLDEVMKGKLREVYIDAAMRNAILYMTDIDIALRAPAIDDVRAMQQLMKDSFNSIRASNLLNPEVNSLLLGYHERLSDIFGEFNTNVTPLPVAPSRTKDDNAGAGGSIEIPDNVVYLKDWKYKRKNQPKRD